MLPSFYLGSTSSILPLEPFKALQTALYTCEVDVSDVTRLFKLLGDGRGQIEHDKFISGIRRAMGTAKNIDMVETLGKT